MTELIGIYIVDGYKNVHLIELVIKAKYTGIDIGKFTQKQEGIDQSEWQLPWDEKYLNPTGTEISGDWVNPPTVIENTTLFTFFFHALDFNKPLISPFGDIKLKPAEKMPERLKSIIEYEPPE
jgi:hypothetical protein